MKQKIEIAGQFYEADSETLTLRLLHPTSFHVGDVFCVPNHDNMVILQQGYATWPHDAYYYLGGLNGRVLCPFSNTCETSRG
jgi:predicted class III extradiol MEMO1 family dioxygenase